MVGALSGRTLGSASAVAALLLACFSIGIFAVRSTTEGLMLIGALGAVVIYLTGPHRMVWVALFSAFASLPEALHVAKVIGPVSVYAHHVALLLAIAFLIPLARLRFSRYALPLTLALAVTFFAATGMLAGNDPQSTAREASFLYEMIAGFTLAMLIVRTGYVRQSIRVIAVVLWFSAGMILASSFTGLQLAGRAESLQSETGAAAIRILTATQTPAVAVLTALVAAQILGRARPAAWVGLGVPALTISLLSFSRNTLIALAVAAAVALLASASWAAMRRSATLVAAGVAVVAVAIPVALFLFEQFPAGVWLSDQVNAFTHRVIGGVSRTALIADPSTLARLRENANLWHAAGESPLLGHGLGYAYQLPFGKSGTFTATLGTTYAHNFYLWWLVKAGFVGMATFALFASAPVVNAVRSVSGSAKICAAVSAALLAICVVDPLPLEPASSLVLGMALGAAAAFSRTRERAVPAVERPIEPPVTPTALPVARTSG